MKQINFNITTKDKLSLSFLTRNALQFDSDVIIKYDDTELSAKRILKVLEIDTNKTKEFTININGNDEDKVLESLQDCINNIKGLKLSKVS